MRIIAVVGARPNLMKMAPVTVALRAAGHDVVLVHTGQHYDAQMSQVFFDELRMPKPDVNLEVGSASHAVQTARIMERFEGVVLGGADCVIVAGDVNSTIACALVAVKLGIRVAHLEAGLRSFDRSMPEEINRVLTDQISDVLLTPSPDADDNLRREGIADDRIFRVGNAMIDSLRAQLELAKQRAPLASLNLKAQNYALLTLHRPSNVDVAATLRGILEAVRGLADHLPIVFPVHPRTTQRLEQAHLESLLQHPNLRQIGPLGYLEFLGLQAQCRFVLTDSGGLQEETTCMGIPCLTLRDNTERPITISEGTNVLVGTTRDRILREGLRVLEGQRKPGRVPDLWDGHTAERVVQVFKQL